MKQIKKCLIILCFVLLSTLLSGCVFLIDDVFINMDKIFSSVSEQLEEEPKTVEIEAVQTTKLEQVVSNENAILPYFKNNELCFVGEVYHEKDDICTLPVTCESSEACAIWGDQVIRELKNHYDGFEQFYGFLYYYYDDEYSEEESSTTNSEAIADEEQGLSWFESIFAEVELERGYNEELLATFQLEDLEFVRTTENSEDADYYEWYWNEFKWIIPNEHLWMLDSFSIFNDEELLAYVIETEKDLSEWNLAINVTTNISYQDSISTHVHEFAHLLFLNSEQLNAYESKFACSTDVFVENMGCAQKASYIHDFVDTFGYKYNGDYDAERFVSEYASTNALEDMAESFYMFVLTERPTGNAIADQKVAFFYNYDELVSIRTNILSRVATYMYRVL